MVMIPPLYVILHTIDVMQLIDKTPKEDASSPSLAIPDDDMTCRRLVGLRPCDSPLRSGPSDCFQSDQSVDFAGTLIASCVASIIPNVRSRL